MNFADPIFFFIISVQAMKENHFLLAILRGEKSPCDGFLRMRVLFWLLRRISVSHTPLKHLALPQTQLPWTEMFFDAFRSHESLPSLKHAHSPSRHMRTTARTVIKHSEPDFSYSTSCCVDDAQKVSWLCKPLYIY